MSKRDIYRANAGTRAYFLGVMIRMARGFGYRSANELCEQVRLAWKIVPKTSEDK